MASLGDILISARKARDEIAAGNFVAGGRALVEVQTGILDIAEDIGFKAGPDDDKIKAEINSTLAEARAAIDAPKASGPVGKLGDGTFLKIILDALIKFAPLFF